MLFHLFDDFSGTNHRLAEACVFHVEAFKFCFFLSKEVKRGLVGRGFCRWFLCCWFLFSRLRLVCLHCW